MFSKSCASSLIVHMHTRSGRTVRRSIGSTPDAIYRHVLFILDLAEPRQKKSPGRIAFARRLEATVPVQVSRFRAFPNRSHSRSETPPGYIQSIIGERMRRKNRKWVATAVALYLFVMWSAYRWGIAQRPTDGKPLRAHRARSQA